MEETRFEKMCRCIPELGLWNSLSLLMQLVFSKNEIKIFSKKLIYPIFLRKKTSDFSIFYNIFVKKEYGFDYGDNVNTVIDLGANIGLAAVFFKNKFPECIVISVEPEEKNFKMLKRNTTNYKNVFILNNAIWNESKNLFIENTKDGEWGFMVSQESDFPEQTIKSITIDQIIEEYKLISLDVLKIDIEGSEKDLFQTNFEKWLPITKRIVIELHEGMRLGSTKAFFAAISKYDFSVSFVGENLICTFNH